MYRTYQGSMSNLRATQGGRLPAAYFLPANFAEEAFEKDASVFFSENTLFKLFSFSKKFSDFFFKKMHN